MELWRVLFVLLIFLEFCFTVPVRHCGQRRQTHFYDVGDGFFYHKNAVAGNTAYFKCGQYERGCLGRAIWKRGRNFRVSQRHTCRRDVYHVQERQLIRSILERCRRLEMTSFRNIIREERRRFPLEVQLRVSYRRLRTSMRNARMSRFPHPPASLQELSNLFQNRNLRIVTMTEDGMDNLYAGSVTAGNGSHAIFFASQRMLRFARDQPILFGNGTFKTVPAAPESQQIFTVVTSHQHHVVPIAWVLMESQTTSAYEAVLRVLRLLLGPGIALRQVITDYEAGQQNAWMRVFPNINLQGCLFHMARAFVKFAKRRLNLYNFMRYGPIRDIIRLCIALALIPLNLVNRAYRIILRSAVNEGRIVYRRVQPFLRYVYRRWINHRRRRRYMNCCDSENRTNNISESHNRQLSREIGCPHPNIYHFLYALVRMESDAYLNVRAIHRGARLHRPRRITSIVTDARLRAFLADLQPRRLNQRFQAVPPNDAAILRYLRRACYLFENVYNDALDDV